MKQDLDYLLYRELVEFLVDHDVIWKILNRKVDDAKRDWIKSRLRERRREESLVSWEDVEAEYEQKFPRELSPIEKLHAEFLTVVPHPELHGGKRRKAIWAMMEDQNLGFMDFVERESLATEEGSLFSYLARVMKFARMLHDATGMTEWKTIEDAIRGRLSVIDERVLEDLG